MQEFLHQCSYSLDKQKAVLDVIKGIGFKASLSSACQCSLCDASSSTCQNLVSNGVSRQDACLGYPAHSNLVLSTLLVTGNSSCCFVMNLDLSHGSYQVILQHALCGWASLFAVSATVRLQSNPTAAVTMYYSTDIQACSDLLLAWCLPSL